MAAHGFDQQICQTFKVTDQSSTKSAATTGPIGQPDLTLTSVANIDINKDSGVAGIGCAGIGIIAGSAQKFTSVTAAWYVVRIGNAVAGSGGFLQKSDGTTFAVTDLPSTDTKYKNVIALCSDGIRFGHPSTGAWETPTVS